MMMAAMKGWPAGDVVTPEEQEVAQKMRDLLLWFLKEKKVHPFHLVDRKCLLVSLAEVLLCD